MESVSDEQIKGTENTSSAAVPWHVHGRLLLLNPKLPQRPMLHSFLLSYLGTELQDPSSTTQGGTESSHPGESDSPAASSGEVEPENSYSSHMSVQSAQSETRDLCLYFWLSK